MSQGNPDCSTKTQYTQEMASSPGQIRQGGGRREEECTRQ